MRCAPRKKHVIRCFGLKWVSMMLLVPVPWSRRVWALPFLTALCWPAEKTRPAPAQDQCGLGPADDEASAPLAAGAPAGVGRRWRLCRGVAGPGLCQTARWSWSRACAGMPRCITRQGPQPPGKRGPKPTKGKRQRSLQGWAERSDTPWETVEVDWYGGQRKTAVGLLAHRPVVHPAACPRSPSATSWWRTRRGNCAWKPSSVPTCRPRRCRSWQWVVMRWSVEVTFEEARAHLGLETQRQWSDQAIARTTPVLLALFSLVTVLALQLSQGGQIPVPVTAWYHKAEPTFADCLALVRRHLWRARYLVNSAAEAEFVQFPREALRALAHMASR